MKNVYDLKSQLARQLFKRAQLSLLISLILLQSFAGIALAAAPDAPDAAGGEESITVSNFTPGATLQLYLSNGIHQATETNVTGPSYTFNNVEPNSLYYYVTQTVGGEESINSSFINSTLRAPVATAGIGYVDISNVHPNASVTLYNSSGGSVSSSPVNQGGGVFRFDGLTARSDYYAVQSINGVDSVATSTVTVLPYIPAAPAAASGEESITASGFESGATLKLYLTNGSWQATAASVTDSTYTFSNVDPNSLLYYVTQTVGGEESTNSSFINSSLRAPVATAGIGYVDISNVHPNASVTLYNSSGGSVSSSPVDQGGGVFRFDGLTARSEYYAVQSINGVDSIATSTVTVLPYIPAAPAAASGEESITASGFEPGATLKLYLTNGFLQDTATNVTDPSYTFNDVEPNSLSYYVTQTVGGEESTNSSFINSSLRTPVATAGIGYVDITNVHPNASITLYTSGGGSVSSSPVDQGGGVFRFNGLTARSEYYAVQSINGIDSDSTSIVTVQPDIPTAPTAVGGEELITASDFEPGATLKLYLTNGSLQATATNVTDPSYTFNDVEPNSLSYYVTQTVGGEESTNSSFINASLRTPVATAGIGYVDITNVHPNASITLYTSGGSSVSSSPVDQGGGVFRFDGLTARSEYYAVQSINGVDSIASSTVTVKPNIYAAPTAASGEESITASGFEPGATLKLYLTNGSLQATAISVTGSTYTFNDIEPNSLYYYVTQTVGAEESLNSSFINASLRTPIANAGLTYVDISNVYPGATVTLYTIDGSPVSSSPVDQGNGIYRFEEPSPGRAYYAVQSINGVLSEGSTIVWVPAVASAPTHVTAVASNGQAVVSFNAPADDGGNTITSYVVTASPGNIIASGTTSPITVTGLSNGTSYTFTVKAINAVGSSASSEASAAVTPYSSSSSSSNTTTTTNTALDLQLNGKTVDVGTVVTTKQNEQLVTTVTLDKNKLENQLLQQGTQIASISVNRTSDTMIIEGDGELIKSLISKGITLDIRTPQAMYTLPAEQINVDALAAQLGSSLSLNQIKITIKISAPSAAQMSAAQSAAAKQGLALAIPPIDFIVQAAYGGKSVDVAKFNAYVERTLTLPDGIDTSKITTGIVIEPDGTIRHVPTIIFEKDGKAYAKINSLTNSLYSVIWNPITFDDVQTHWGKDAINEMGSRLVIEGTGNGLFSPARDITRAEFAAILVRGLGLQLESGAAVFSDVPTSAWYSGAVNTAHAYGLIGGFEDGTYRPNDRITREQAMLMIAKAMKLTNLKSQLPAQSIEQTLQAFKDAGKASAWALGGIADSVQAGIVSGRSDAQLEPKAFITRAEVASIIQRLLKASDLI
ncbi:S-layer homology domain-containing protein [Paenibacillus sp. KS-LC4]|uniref:S-layer homology domain-containing protein n=1 Tax=Paenibacillus sp. KS-LC4 TaxID=2979727 RepID=UPI0030CA9947